MLPISICYEIKKIYYCLCYKKKSRNNVDKFYLSKNLIFMNKIKMLYQTFELRDTVPMSILLCPLLNKLMDQVSLGNTPCELKFRL